MYYTKLDSKSNHILITCKAIIGDTFWCRDFLFDTGASRTLIPASSLSEILCEEDLIAQGCKISALEGCVKGKPLKVYEVPLDCFIVGTINLGPTNVKVTFDKRVSIRLLGMDIIKKLNFLYNKDTDTLALQTPYEQIVTFSTLLNMLKQPACSGMKEYLLNLVPPSIIEIENLNTENAKLAYAIKQLNRFY